MHAPYGTVKVHFARAGDAIDASIDGSCTQGATYKSGKPKTWISKVAKISPHESALSAARRVKKLQRMTLDDARAIVGNRPRWELANICLALSLHPWLNTPDEAQRLRAVKLLLNEVK